MSTEQTHGNGSASAEVAARVERRWATIAVIIIVMMALLAAFAGIHRATMPQPRVETTDPPAFTCPASSSRAISAACWRPMAM